MSTSSPIERLPEELLLSIFELLDSEAPSVTKSRQEPSLQLTTSDVHGYKDLSSVSKRWRRIVLPLLFRYSKISLEEGIEEYRNSSPGQAFTNLLRHKLNSFLSFVKENGLNVQSVVVSANKRLTYLDGPPDRGREIVIFWRNLLRSTNVPRIVIVAPPQSLAMLTQCTIDMSTEWAFDDMDFHLLEMRCDPNPELAKNIDHRTSIQRVIAPYSILKLRAWHHLGLNEGSFIKAYGTYEYFERGPPSLILSIMKCFFTPEIPWSCLRSFSYTAILPFANHLDFPILPHLDELDIQLAPDPRSNILNDRSRIGRAQMEDCWQEFRTAYADLIRPFCTFAISRAGSPKLKKFICRDYQIPALGIDLDDLFVPLCMPCWCEHTPGVFSRLASVPPRNEYWD